MKHIIFSIAFTLLLGGLAFTQNIKDLQTDPDGNMDIKLEFFSGEKQLQKSDVYNPYLQYDIDPGVYPEGDFMGASTFTPDGQSVILTNRISNMVTIYDFNSMSVIANVEVGDYPSCAMANDTYAIVGCQFSDSIYLIDLSNYSIAGIIPTGEQPCSIELSPDGNIAYVACDIDDICMAIDIPSQTVLGQIDDFPIFLNTISWATQVNRSWEKYNNFVVLPGGEKLAINAPDGDVVFFSTTTLLESDRITIEEPRAVSLSGDGNYLVCAANPGNLCTIHQIDLSSMSISHTVEVTGNYLATNAVVVNQDGSKAYIGTGSNTSTLIRFDTEDFVSFSATYTAFWLGVSFDHHYAVSGQNRFSIIDFDSESIVDSYWGLSQSFGTVSPVSNHVFAYDPLRYEGAYFFDFSDPENISYAGNKLSGADPEGDTPGAVAISNDRSIAVSANNLSNNSSVFDLVSMSNTGTVELGESCYDVKITPDGLWAVAGGYDENEVKIIDLSNNTLATTIYTGQRPMIVELSPDGQYAYIGNIKSNTLSVIELDGANSSLITSKPCGVIGVYIPYFGIRSAIRISPDGNTILVCASFDDEIKVFDTQVNDFVASLPTGDFPLDVAFTSDGNRACVLNTYDHTFDIISIDGASSSVLFHNTLSGDYPMDVAYDEAGDNFYICTPGSNKISMIHAATGESAGTIQTAQSPFHVEIYQGSRLVQLQGDDTHDHKITFGDGPFEFVYPYAAAPFSINKNAGMIGVAMPGPDLISIIDIDPSLFIDENSENNLSFIYPNPATNKLFIKTDTDYKVVEIMDMKGQILIRKHDKSEDGIDISSLCSGYYIIRISNHKMSYSQILVKD